MSIEPGSGTARPSAGDLAADAGAARARLHRAILDSAVDFAIIALDAAGRVIEWNPGAERILGWPAADILGCSADLIFVPEDRAENRLAAEMRQAVRDGRSSEERWHLHRDGTRFWANGELMPLTGEAGEHIGFLKIVRDRTARRAKDRALRVSTERLQLAAETGLVGAWDWNVPTDRVQADARFAALFGIDPVRAASGVPIAAFFARVHPDDRDRVRDAVFRVPRTGGEYETDYRVVAPDGELRWVLARGRCDHDADGKPLRVPGIAIDVTRTKLAKAAAASAQAALQVAVQGSHMGWYDHNPTEGRYFWDDRIRAMFGLTPDDEAGLPLLRRMMPPEDRVRFDEALERVFRSDRDGPFQMEYRIHRLDTGEQRWISSWGQTFFENERCIRFVGFLHDVTDRKRSELQLLESKERLALAVDAAGVGIWDAGPGLESLHWDDRVRAMFGLAPGAGIDAGRNLAAIHADDRPAVERALAAAFDPAGGGEYDAEFRAIGIEDGVERWLQAKGRVRFEHGVPARFLGTVRDVTEEKRSRQALLELNATLEQRVAQRSAELARAQEALLHSQKMEAVGQLTGGLAHDFNNLLTGIAGSLELLQTRVAQGRLQDLGRYVTVAREGSRRAAALTHRLLAFSRRQTLDPKPIDANRLITEMEDMIRRTVGPGVAVEVATEPALWATLADASQLENSLLNLAINARDAMPDGGRLRIATANCHPGDRVGADNDLPSGHYVCLSVSDTGVGMTPEVAARAFDPFFTTKPIGQGTGLGLSMIYGFARQSGGRARILSQPGGGTEVRLTLPRYAGEVEPDAPAEADAQPRAETGETVLVVDDEPSVRLLMADVLGELGYGVIEAEDGASGMAVIGSGARIDLLITDVGLPGGMNGRQVADAARAVRPGLQVLFVTGYAENAVVGNGRLERGMHILTKPFAMDGLAARVRSILARR